MFHLDLAKQVQCCSQSTPLSFPSWTATQHFPGSFSPPPPRYSPGPRYAGTMLQPLNSYPWPFPSSTFYCTVGIHLDLAKEVQCCGHTIPPRPLLCLLDVHLDNVKQVQCCSQLTLPWPFPSTTFYCTVGIHLDLAKEVQCCGHSIPPRPLLCLLDIHLKLAKQVQCCSHSTLP